MISIFTGTIAGLAHVLSGPDHLAAVAPMAIRDRRRSWLLGLQWALGHSAGVILVGLVSVCFREVLPVDLISSWSERLVGIVLIGIGLWGLKRTLAHRVHWHEHAHDGLVHAHFHVHDPDSAHNHLGEWSDGKMDLSRSRHRHSHAAFAVGGLHGLAGGAHFLAVLPALAFPTMPMAAGYLLAYALGTMVGMVGFSSLMGEVAQRFSWNSVRAHWWLMTSCSILAMMVGGFWLMG